MVLADQAVPDRFPWTGHAHGKVQKAHGRGGRRILVQHRLVAADPGEVVDVARFGHADDGVNEQVRLNLFRGPESQFLMGAVQGVPGLERHDLAPAKLPEVGAQFVRCVAAGAEVVVDRLLDAGDGSAEVDGARVVVQVVDRRMSQVIGAKDFLGLMGFVGGPFVRD